MDNLAERGGQHISTSNELRPQWEPTSLDSFGGDYPPALDMSASPHKVDPREGPEQDMEQYDARPHASSDPGQSFVEGEIPQQDRRKSATAACAMTGKVCKCDNPENSFTGCPSHDSRLSYSHNGTDPTSTIKASGIDNSRTHVGMMTSNPEPGAYALGYLGSRPGSVSMEEHARLVNADYGRTGLASTVLPVDMPLLRPQDADSLPRRVSNRNSQNMQGQDLAPSSERMRPTGQGVNPARSHVMETYRCPPSRLWDSSSWNLVDSRRPLSIEDPNSNSIRLAPSVVTPDKFSDHPVSPRSLSTNPHQGSPIPAPASGLSFANSFSSPASCPSSANSFPSAAPAPYYQTEWASTVPNDLTPSAAPNHSTLSSSNFGDTQSPTWAGPDRLSSGETLEIPFNSLAHNNRLEVTNPSSRRGLSEAQILQTRHQDPSLFLDPNDTHLEHAHANRRRKGSARGQKQAERRSVSSTGENQGSPSSLKRPSEATEATDSSRTRAKRRFTVAEREEINAKRGRVKYCGFDCQRRKIKVCRLDQNSTKHCSRPLEVHTSSTALRRRAPIGFWKSTCRSGWLQPPPAVQPCDART